MSVRVRNFETNQLKVNDADGNPVEIAAIVVWQVADTAKAIFAVDDYLTLRRACRPSPRCGTSRPPTPTTTPTSDGTSLRGSTDVVADELAARGRAARRRWPASRSSRSGSATSPTRPEIAQAMLRRQQANAVVAARSRIVEGAVGMVEMALDRLDERGIVELDEERKAAMVSNLLVVLCGDQPASPVVNTGTLYTLSRERDRKQLAAPDRPRRARRAGPVGRRRAAQRQRADRDAAAPGPGRRRPDAHGRPPIPRRGRPTREAG